MKIAIPLTTLYSMIIAIWQIKKNKKKLQTKAVSSMFMDLEAKQNVVELNYTFAYFSFYLILFN